MRALNVDFDALNGVVYDELDTDRRGEMDNNIRISDETIEDRLVQHGFAHESKLGMLQQRLHVFNSAGREVVDDRDVSALRKTELGQVRSDETGASGDQHMHLRLPNKVAIGCRSGLKGHVHTAT